MACLLGSAIVLLLRRPRLAGTTLVAPATWMLFALVVLSLTFLAETVMQPTPSASAAIRYLAGTCTLCPLMAVLGAKRPQNTGWQFIVGTLWLVLILPVGEMFILWTGGAMDVGSMRSWFLLILLLVGVTNYLLTRFAIVALLGTVGQSLLLLPHLPGQVTWEPHFVVGATLIVSACCLLCWSTQRTRTGGKWNLVWIEFRDWFGLVWGLRVMERINEAARLCEWERELTWFGFEENDSQEESPDREQVESMDQKQIEVERTMRTTLRRFVSPEWIEQRHGSL